MTLTLATFNVKDLFDATDDESRGHLDAKLACLAGVVAKLDADVLAMQEVGSGEVLEALLARIAGRGGYGEPLLGTADARGIRCAVLSRIPVIAWRVHAPAALTFPVFREGDAQPFGDRIPMRRGIVHAEVSAGALGKVDVFAAHFKSKRRLFLGAPEKERARVTGRELAEAELRSVVWRAAESLFVRGLVDEALARDPEGKVAVMGDLNDVPGSLVLRILYGAGGDALRSTGEAVEAARRYSLLHAGRREEIDHVLVTENLLARLVEARFFNDELRDHGSLWPAGAPAPLPAPDSDHAPLVARFA